MSINIGNISISGEGSLLWGLEKVVYAICFKDPLYEEDGWMNLSNYIDLKEAKKTLKLLIKNNPYNRDYKIMRIAISCSDIITDKTFPLIEHRETCDCFYCGKRIEAGDELVFVGGTEEAYCSHECASMAQYNERMTILKARDEYMSWFKEE